MEFNEGIQDLIACTSSAAQAGKNLKGRMAQLSEELFAAYDKDSSGAQQLSLCTRSEGEPSNLGRAQ